MQSKTSSLTAKNFSHFSKNFFIFYTSFVIIIKCVLIFNNIFCHTSYLHFILYIFVKICQLFYGIFVKIFQHITKNRTLARFFCYYLSFIFTLLTKYYFVPKILSPASPKPGRIYPFSFKHLSNVET